MSIDVMAMVWKADLPSTAKLVLLRLADFASDDGGRIFPAVSTIAAECGLGERTVQDQLRALEARGVLCLVREAVCATRRPREYRIDLSTLEALKRTEKKKKTRQPGANTAPGAGTAPDADTAPGAGTAPDANTAPGATGAPVPRDSRTSPPQQPHQSPAAAAPNPPYEPSENPSGEPPTATAPPCGTPPSRQAVVRHVRDLIAAGHSDREAARMLGLGTRHDLIGDLVGSSATGGRRWGDEHWETAVFAISDEAATSDQTRAFFSLLRAFRRDVPYAAQRMGSALGMTAAQICAIEQGKKLLSKDEAGRFIPRLERALSEERRNPRPRKQPVYDVY